MAVRVAALIARRTSRLWLTRPLRPIARAVPQDVEVVDMPGGLAQWRPFDTETFRRAETGQFRRPDAVPGEEQRRIWPTDHRGDQ